LILGVLKDGIRYLDNDGSGTLNAGDKIVYFGATGGTSVVRMELRNKIDPII
jgi:hypothetical protein